MALNGGNAANAAGSKVTIAERWIKLYRKIHNLFLKKDFTNRQDFEFTVKQLNLRIDSLEQQLNTAINALNTKFSVFETHYNAHTHVSPPAPVNPVVTAPTVPSLVPAPPATSPVTQQARTTTQFVEQRDTILQSTGEAVVPVDTSI